MILATLLTSVALFAQFAPKELVSWTTATEALEDADTYRVVFTGKIAEGFHTYTLTDEFSATQIMDPVATDCKIVGEPYELSTPKEEIDEFGENTVLVRRVPMDIAEGDVSDTLLQMADDLLSGRNADTDTVRDELLHTMACKAAIKAGWKTDDRELLALVKEVMAREELKYCPHGRPICITLSKKQLEKQFKRT